MRIAFVVTEFPSRSQTFVRDQINGLIERGHTVDVYAVRNGDPGSPPEGVRLVHPASRTQTVRWALAHPRNAGDALRALEWGVVPAVSSLRFAAAHDGPARYDVVHCHFGPNGMIGGALRTAGYLSGALVVTFHGYDLSAHLARAGRSAYDVLCRNADLMLPVTQRWCDLLIQLGCDPARVRVHRMGVDTREFRPAPQLHDPVRIEMITVARLVEKKGIEYAIRAVAALPRTLALRYTIVGDGPLRANLESLIRSLGVSDRVRLTGWSDRDEVRSVLRESHVAVVPSVRASNGDEEGLPVFLMEAMATGLAVVATRHSGIPELVRHERDGLLVGERDVAALTNALERLVTSMDLRVKLGSSARQRVVELHDSVRLLDELIENYGEAVRRARQHRSAA